MQKYLEKLQGKLQKHVKRMIQVLYKEKDAQYYLILIIIHSQQNSQFKIQTLHLKRFQHFRVKQKKTQKVIKSILLGTTCLTIYNSKIINGSILDIDPKTYSYEFSAYLTTVDTNKTIDSLIQLNCHDHNQKIQVICCDRSPNKDNDYEENVQSFINVMLDKELN
ncbi:unnamed protein product [Paramecium sonneborni]|uniref:Uncharacterized protein n=1 Tax=Paramecium sonneborni TaxID=65129 RepID=A0A8S1QM42_9CILI|nr:unnamed protein product [Paramecium sonneborni]